MKRNVFFCPISAFMSASSQNAQAREDFFETHIGLWNFASLIPATISIFVSGIGLLLIWGQLKASKKTLADSSRSAQAAADAARISFAATRPWIKFSVSTVYLSLNSGNPEQVGCQIDYTIKNIGNTPALNAGIVFKPLPVGQGTNIEISRELSELRQTKLYNPRVIFPNDQISEGLSTNFDFPRLENEEMLNFKVIAAVIYKSSPDGEVFWTPIVLQLQQAIPPADRVYRFFRGMGHVKCLAILLGEETPPPT